MHNDPELSLSSVLVSLIGPFCTSYGIVCDTEIKVKAFLRVLSSDCDIVTL